MTSKKTEATEKLELESALNELEKIVQELEKGQLGLNDGLKKFEQGVLLYQNCRQSLEEAEKKVKLLTEGLTEEEWRE